MTQPQIGLSGILLVLSVVVGGIWWTQRWQRKAEAAAPAGGEAEPASRSWTLVLARVIRRLARWLWAAGEGLEVGWRHAREVRGNIKLELRRPNSSASLGYRHPWQETMAGLASWRLDQGWPTPKRVPTKEGI